MQKNKRRLIAVVIGVLVFAVGSVWVYRSSSSDSPLRSANIAQPLSHHQLEEVKSKLTQLLEENDPKTSLDYLRKAIQNDTALARECHPILHHIGRSAYEKYKDFEKTISYQDGLCNSGYTHGTIEAHLMASENIQATLKATCSTQESKITFRLWQCYHGVGHGVMYFTGKDLSQSLSLCESLAVDFARESCANGAFMERFIIVSHSGSTTSNTSNINTSLCMQQKDTYKSDCCFYAPTAYLQRNIYDYTGAFKECKNSEEKYIANCMHGVGGQSVKENITRPEIARDVCKKAPRDYRSSCINGAISLLINHHASTVPVEPLCDTIFAQYKDLCAEKVRSWNDYYST